MKKRTSLRSKKKSRTGPKIIVVNKRFLIIGVLILLVCGLLLIINSKEPEPTKQAPSNNSVAQASNDYQISIIDNSTGGDISNNTVLMDEINQTPVITELLEAAKNGTPMLILGNGSQPRVMIVAGVHGAELPPQIAATNLINNLNGKKINGTIYIIPFAIPRDTANDTRIHNGTDPDRVANIPGTPVNIISNTSKNNKVTLLGDFHSAQPNDVPGKNCIIYDPQNPKSLKLARFINNKTKSPLIKVGNYSGVLSTVSNRNGITSVICEVLSPHSELAPSSVELSTKYMMVFLEYAEVYNNNKK